VRGAGSGWASLLRIGCSHRKRRASSTLHLIGLERLIARGVRSARPFAREASQRFKDDNNPVSEFARTALRKSETSRVARLDLSAPITAGSWRWKARPRGPLAREGVFSQTCAASMPGLCDYQEHSGARFLTGAALTDEGLSHWERHIAGPQLKGGSRGISTDKAMVNRAWDLEGNTSADMPF
jgi:hypothetical protein